MRIPRRSTDAGEHAAHQNLAVHLDRDRMNPHYPQFGLKESAKPVVGSSRAMFERDCPPML